MKNELIITTDEEEQPDILARNTYLEQDNGDKKRIGFEINNQECDQRHPAKLAQALA